jgi:hypothetical protein
MLVSAWGWSLLAQQAPSPQSPTSETDPQYGQQPLTPAQQREQEIRQFDPLDNSADQEGREAQRARDAANRSDQDTATRPSPQVTADDDSTDKPAQEYNGPEVLSRSYSLNGLAIPEQVKWTETIGFSSVYNTGTGTVTAADGSQSSGALVGTQLNWSLGGRHRFRHDQIGFTYSGNLSRYNGPDGFNGANNSMAIDYKHVITRRISLNVTASGSILSQNYILSNPVLAPGITIANIDLGTSPNVQITDQGVKQFSTQADITWQKSTRLSFDAGTSYFAIVRDAPGLLGMTGQQVHGDANYRLIRNVTIGSYYSFSYYSYPHGVGTSDININTIGGSFSYGFSRSVQLSLRVGLSSIESLGQQTVPIAPAIAALLGQSSGIIDAYSKTLTSDISAQLTKNFRGGRNVSFAFAHGVSPGNGFFQTSEQQTITANVSTPILRDYTLQTSVGWSTLTALGQALSQYASEYATIGLSRKLRRGVTLNFSAQFRHFDEAGLITTKNQLGISSGLTWGQPGGRIWPF